MKQQFVFPAVLYFDEDNNNYAVAFNDLDIFTEGNTVEDAFKSAKDYLLAYLRFNKHLNNDLDSATDYITVKQSHEKDIVLLIDAEIDDEEIKNDIVNDFDNDIDIFDED